MTSSRRRSRPCTDCAEERKHSRAPAGAFCLLVLALAILVVSNCQDKTDGGGEINPEEAEVAEEFTLTQTFEGKKAWVLKAKSARSLRDEEMISIMSPHLDFYSREGDVYSTLVSDSGVYYLASTDVKAVGHVVVVSADSAVLETDSLKWLSRAREIRTEASVRVTKGATVITGDGLVSDPGLENIKIEKNFRAESLDKGLEKGLE
jgi:LPS export ABC transporter protein LptC